MTDDARQIGIEFTTEGADTAARDVERVADALEQIEDDAATARVDADTEQAERNVRSFEDQLDDLTEDSRELRIRFREQQLRRKIGDALRDLERLEDPVEIEARTDDLERAQGELRDLERLASERYEIEIDADPKRTARRAADDLEGMRARGEGLQSAIPAIRGFGDELGGTAAGAGIASQAVADLGDFSLIMGERFASQGGRVATVATRLGTVLGAAGLAGAIAGIGVQLSQVALPALRSWIGSSEETIEANEELRGTFDSVATAMRNAEYEEAVRAFVRANDELITSGQRLGLSTDEIVRYALRLDGALDFGAGVDRTSEQFRQFEADIAFVRDGILRAEADLLNLDNIAPTIADDLFLDALSNAEDLDEFQEILRGKFEDLPDSLDGLPRAISAAEGPLQRVEEELSDVEQAARDARGALDWEQSVLRTARTAGDALGQIASASNVTREDIVDAKIAVDDWALSLENLPKTVATEVQALIDEGSYRVAQARLAVLTARETKIVDVYVPGVTPLPTPGSPGPNGGVGNIPTNIEGFARAPSTINNVTVNPPPRLEGRDVAQSADRFSRVNGNRPG